MKDGICLLYIRKLLGCIAIICISITLIPQVLSADNAKEYSLNDLEQIVSRASNVHDFLADPNLLESYYIAIKSYYKLSNETFPRESFDKFIQQLTTLVFNSPEFATAIWSSTDHIGKKHVVEVVPFEGTVTVNHIRLKEYWQIWKQKNIDFIRGHFDGFQIATKDERIKSLLDQVSKEISEFQTYASNLSAHKKNYEQGQFYAGLKANPKLKAAILAYQMDLIEGKLNSPDVTDLSATELISIFTNDRRSSVDKSDIPIVVDQLAYHLLPTKQHLEQLGILNSSPEEYKGQGMKPGKYFFVPSPRPIHTIFKGVCLNECVGGSTEQIDNLTPERWASAVLKGVQLYFVERMGKNQGWIQLLPIQKIEDKKVYLNLEVSSPVFNSEVSTIQSQNRKTSFTDLWLKAFLETQPESPSIVIGESDAINNSGSLVHIRDSLAHRLGGYVGHHTSFRFLEESIVKVIANNSPKKGPSNNDLISRYSNGNMILDATSKKVGSFRVLNAVPDELKYDSVVLADSFKNQPTRDWQIRWISQFIQFDFSDSAMNKLIKSWWFNLTNQEKEEVYRKLSFDAYNGVLRSSKLVLELVLTDKKAIEKAFLSNQNSNVNFLATSVSRFEQLVVQRKFSMTFWEHSLSKGGSIKNLIGLRELLIKAINSPAEFLFAVSPHIDIPTEEYLAEIDKLILANLDKFFSLQPTTNDIGKLIKLSKYVSTSMAIYRKSLHQLRSATDFLALLKIIEYPSVSFTKELDKLIRENTTFFMSLGPSPIQVNEYLSSARTNETATLVVDSYLPIIKTKRQWKDFFESSSDNLPSSIENIKKSAANKNQIRFQQLPGTLEATLKKASNIARQLWPRPNAGINNQCSSVFISR